MEAIAAQARRAFQLLLPRLHSRLTHTIRARPLDWATFIHRLERHFPTLFTLYYQLYGTRFDFFYYLEDLLLLLARSWFKRPADLKALDEQREHNPLWFQSHTMLGGVIYVDLFAGNLEGVRARIPYFQELGLTYLHLMPLFKMPEGENDGGYAVSSYRHVHPSLGTMTRLRHLASELRAAGISLVLDFVLNHTSNEHEWAQRARRGEPEYQAFYRVFPDRHWPDQYERHLREIFPDEHPGAFTYIPDFVYVHEDGRTQQGAWVWTTFHSYQWDLNYENPAVFNRMAAEMLFLANQGVEILRLDAVAFLWKRLGTSCENLPEAHILIRAFNAIARIAAPALYFKSEAIVHPDEVVRYIDPAECQLSYNPLLMALLWNSLATRKVRLLSHALAHRFAIHPETAWVNYVRCHDDIGWTFSDEDAAILGINGRDHRHFLNEFYRGRFPGSFARGLPFQENPKTGDCRISGTCASLAGLEKALQEEGPQEVELALRRIWLLHAIAFTVGGIPLIYLGDEIATLNDYSYRHDPNKAGDSRWVHRPRLDWQRYARRHDSQTIEGRAYRGFQRLIALRKQHSVFSCGHLTVLPTDNPHVLAFQRQVKDQSAIVVANFSEQHQYLSDSFWGRSEVIGRTPIFSLSEQTSIAPLAPLELMVLM